MVMILCLYVVALWVVFSKFKLVRWGWLSGTVAVLVGVFILATFLALFNSLTPSGRVTVTGRVVEVTPNVTGMFSQNGFQTIKVDTPVHIVFDNAPGRIYRAKITAIPKGVGQGQIAVSGTLARTNALGGATAFPAVISIPEEMSHESLRLGMSGSATAFADNAGVIGLLASILVWISAYAAYL
jgi:multidrug resistance efflux pump